MRTALILILSAGTALAQRKTNLCQSEEAALQRYKQLSQDKIVAPEQMQAAQEAYAQCQARQAQLSFTKASEQRLQAQLEELRKTYKDSYPDVVALRAKLDELRAQEAGLAQGLRRLPDDAPSLRQATGGLETGLPDRWWKNPATTQSLGLSADQQKKMDDVFQQYRLKLIDLNAALEKEEVTLEPLVGAEPLDEAKITAQIDRVAQARAELEKANGRMLLGIRRQLTPEQWSRLNQGFAPAPARK
jgi:Spy/CpxP family protein refolding chaperone